MVTWIMNLCMNVFSTSKGEIQCYYVVITLVFVFKQWYNNLECMSISELLTLRTGT